MEYFIEDYQFINPHEILVDFITIASSDFNYRKEHLRSYFEYCDSYPSEEEEKLVSGLILERQKWKCCKKNINFFIDLVAVIDPNLDEVVQIYEFEDMYYE